ncbi:MAG: hypothetical protein AAGD07_02375 [Planctomycetota bacterium]
MKSLLNTVAVLVLTLGTWGPANAGENAQESETKAIVTINELESLVTLFELVEDSFHQAVSEGNVDQAIRLANTLAELEATLSWSLLVDSNVCRDRISGTSLGSGRAKELAGAGLGSGR